MRPVDIALANDIENRLLSYNRNVRSLTGIRAVAKKRCFIMQIIDSIRRIKYITVIKNRSISATCADATNIAFDPIKGAVWHMHQNNFDEAFWLVFLFTHFGKSRTSSWQRIKDIYGGLGHPAIWTWERTSQNPDEFRFWLEDNIENIGGSFGNHRKYESLNDNGTGRTIASYIDWVGENHSHQVKITDGIRSVGNNSRELFKFLYYNMNVHRFGRTAKFDYLAMVGKLGLANIEPNSAYMQGATGPVSGAKLLFGGSETAPLTQGELNEYLSELENCLDLHFGMQVLEDALCNWQKNPDNYIHFRG